MTTIAYKNGILAADSRSTTDSEAGGSRVFLCEKIFRKSVPVDGKLTEVLLATAGESSAGMVFVDWFGSGKESPAELFLTGDADFTVLVLQPDGLYEYDAYCRGTKILDPFYAIGSGAKAAMGAMHAGASAKRAVEIACKIDPFSAAPIVTEKLNVRPKAKTRKPHVPEVRAEADAPQRPHASGEDPPDLQR